MTPKCPECGGKPTEQSQVEVQLAHLGYLDSGKYKCSNCGKEWI